MTNIVKIEMPEISNDKIRVLSNLGLVIKDIQAKVDSNNCYIDAQVILDYLTEVTKTDEDPNVVPERVIAQATIAFEYIDGIPAVNGLPIWERLDCESLDFYKLFKIYREQKYVGVNKSEDSEKDSGDNAHRRYQRSFENLKETTEIKRRALYAISKVYHWQMRVDLYDHFRKEFLDLEKNRLISLMESRHQVAAENIFGKCIKYFEGLSDKKLEKISPKDMLAWMSEAIKLNRLALGLPGDKLPVTKVEKTVNITRTDNKTLNLNAPKTDNKYLQELTDILQVAGALPVSLEAKADVIEATTEEGEKDEKDG